jgi:hypothetical protein
MRPLAVIYLYPVQLFLDICLYHFHGDNQILN